MKKNKMLRIASVLLVAVLLSTCAISGTFAKYTSSATLTSTATVAKWSVEVNDTQIALASGSSDPVVAFDLFGKSYDLKADGTVDTTEDEQIKKEGNLIAPGCGGYYDMKIENLSEVDAQYSIDFSLTNSSSIPLEFCLSNSATAADWKSSIDDLDVSATGIAMGTGTATVTLYWRWAFGGDATTGTDLGVAAQGTAPTATVTAAITVEQVD